MFKDFYCIIFFFLKFLLFLLVLLLLFLFCIVDEYISISDDWDEIVWNYKIYYFENGLDYFN